MAPDVVAVPETRSRPVVDAASDSTPDPRRETLPVFDLGADLTAPATFFHQPWPSDSRLREGRPDLRGLPLPNLPQLGARFRDLAAEARGFSQHPVGWFRMTAPLAPIRPDVPIASDVSAPCLLIDIDAGSPSRGRLVPIVAETLDADPYTPSNLLGISPRPGVTLAPNTRYAYVVRRNVLDAAGEPIGAADAVTALLNGDEVPGAYTLSPLFGALAETLSTLAIPIGEVATATVFTTGDSAADLRTLTDAALATHDADISDLAVDPFDGVEHDRFCELHGSISMPQFQSGLPPFHTLGLIDTREGVPAKKRDEQAPVVITLPNTPMPDAGYPLVVYLHGPDGRASDVVDRGVVYTTGGAPTRGEGPAWLLSPHGFATLGVALPMNAQRLPGSAPGALLDTVNPIAIRDNLRQAVIEARLVIHAAERLTISPSAVSGCDAHSTQQLSFRLDPRHIHVLGDRTGGMIAMLVAAVDPIVSAVVTGSAGGDLVALLSASLSPEQSRRLDPSRWGLVGPLSRRHPAHHVAQLALDAADPVVFASRIGRHPLTGIPARSHLQLVGDHDGLAPIAIFDAMATAAEHPQAGEIIWASMSEALTSFGFDGALTYPVHGNRTGADGQVYTSAVVQVSAESPAGAQLPDASAILTQLETLKFQYACFFRSHVDNGVAAIVAPQPLGESCPELSP